MGKKRKRPSGGLSEIKSNRSKRGKEFDMDLSESREIDQYNSSLKNISQYSSRNLIKYEGKWSLLRIASKSRIYQWLLNGLKAVRTVAPGIILSMIYSTFHDCSIPHYRNFNNDKVIQAILNKRKIDISDFSNFTSSKNFIFYKNLINFR